MSALLSFLLLTANGYQDRSALRADRQYSHCVESYGNINGNITANLGSSDLMGLPLGTFDCISLSFPAELSPPSSFFRCPCADDMQGTFDCEQTINPGIIALFPPLYPYIRVCPVLNLSCRAFHSSVVLSSLF